VTERNRLVLSSSLFLFLATVFLASSVSATYVLTNSTFLPDIPLVPGSGETVSATYVLLPSGETTFVKGHELQMQTDLDAARWGIQVVVDGRDAAYQTASGNAAFVNGEILSYPTSQDVSLYVTVYGFVPQTSSGSILVLKAEEIDNTNNVVPESVIALSRPVAAPSPAITTAESETPLPARSSPITPQITKAPGFSYALATAAAAFALLLRLR